MWASCFHPRHTFKYILSDKICSKCPCSFQAEPKSMSSRMHPRPVFWSTCLPQLLQLNISMTSLPVLLKMHVPVPTTPARLHDSMFCHIPLYSTHLCQPHQAAKLTLCRHLSVEHVQCALIVAHKNVL